MLRPLSLIIACIFCLASQALAETVRIITPDALRSAIDDGDTDHVSSALDTAQMGFEAGEIVSCEKCQLYEIFGVTHPDVIAFVANWLAKEPASPYAQVARALINIRAG